jgi:hypothetical protein
MICGWLGMVLIQFATIPTTIKILYGVQERLPPLDLVVLVWSGLALFLVRSIIDKDTLYTISNGLGFVFQSVLLALIVFK